MLTGCTSPWSTRVRMRNLAGCCRLEVDSGCLTQHFHPLTCSGSSYQELRCRFQLGDGDAQRGHFLRRDDIGEGVAAVDEVRGGQVPQSDRNVGAVILCLDGLEIDLRDLGPFGSHSYNIGQGMRGRPWKQIRQDVTV